MLTSISLLHCVLANLCASFFMTGVIWFVQIVHYPLFANVGSATFLTYEQRHAQRTGYVVAPVMIFELASACLLAVKSWNTPLFAIAGAALGLLVIVWLSTFLLQVPCHDRLCREFSAETHRRLVATNWTRSAAWSLRSGLLLWLLLQIAR